MGIVVVDLGKNSYSLARLDGSGESDENLAIMIEIDRQFLDTPF